MDARLTWSAKSQKSWPRPLAVFGSELLQVFSELVVRQPDITHNGSHRDCVDRIVTRYGHNQSSVGHDGMLALPRNPKAQFFEGANGIEVIHSG